MNIENVYRILQELANNFPDDEDKEDLIQDISLDLLERPPRGFNEIEDEKEMKFFLSRILMNNIYSKTSKFYYKYKKHKPKFLRLDEVTNITNKGEETD